MMQYRYVINGKPKEWYNTDSISVLKMQENQILLTAAFGKKWNIEYREEVNNECKQD